MKINPATYLLLPALALLPACSGVRPPVQLADVRSSALSATATELAASMIVGNPTKSPLTIEGAEYRLYLEGQYIGRGSSDAEVTVPAEDEAPQTVTLKVEDGRSLPLLNRLLAGEALTYRLEGTLTEHGGASMRVDSEGRLGEAQ